MRTVIYLVTTLVLAVPAMSDNIRGIDIEFVNIGNPGNAADTGGTPGCGAVDYNYRIGKYEVTNAQWNAFTAAAGVPAGNPPEAYDQGSYFTGDQQPANCISWYEAAQFCNYLTSGNKSIGVYQLGVDGSIIVDRASAIATYDMVYVIPTEDEWYKAAFFKPNGSGYSLYANGTNTAPTAGVNANYDYIMRQPWDVGVGNGTQEQNGTFDMMGNVWEWNEAIIFSNRGLRGGSYDHNISFLPSSNQNWDYTFHDHDKLGFRVASVPEPCTLLLLALGSLMLRKR